MNSRARVIRILGLVVFMMGSLRSGRAQISKNAPASVSKIQDEIRQHPESPKLYVALGLAYWDRNDYPHALEAFQTAVKIGPTSAEAHNEIVAHGFFAPDALPAETTRATRERIAEVLSGRKPAELW